jgi:hypothetical protein
MTYVGKVGELVLSITSCLMHIIFCFTLFLFVLFVQFWHPCNFAALGDCLLWLVSKVALFGHKTDEVTGGWRKLHNEERHNLYCLPNVLR